MFRLPRALLIAFAVVTMTASAADARPLVPAESMRLERGETITREQTITRDDHRYIGGVTYTILDATEADLDALFDNVDAYRRLLPRTKRARLVGTDRGDKLVEITSGNALVEAQYTLRMRREEREGRREIRFWLEPNQPHGIDDAWGFFRMEPFTTKNGERKVLLTYGALVDVGPGIVRELFEEKVRAALLSVPQRVRGAVAEARRAAH